MFNLLLRQQNLPEIGKASNTFGYKKNKIILNKIKKTLPELISRNLILCERLKNKITVSSFMNNTEHKNQKYLKNFVLSSGKRLKDLKTGLSLKKVIKKGINHLSPICNDINNDLIIKNGEFLIKQKKLINEKTEQETHTKIIELIKGIKHIIKPIKIKKKSNSNKIVKSVSEQELNKIKYFIKHELNNDQNKLKYKINFYKNKLNTIAVTNPKEFHKVANNIYLDSNIKMINYLKPKIITIKDSESSNLIRIREHLVQSNLKNDQKKNEENNLEYKANLNKSINIKKPSTSTINESNDTLNILKQLADQNQFLGKKAKTNLKKINSLIDIKLPYFSNYYRTIMYCKNKQEKKNKNRSMDDFYNNNNNNNINKLIDIGFDQDVLLDEIKLIKEEINDSIAPKTLKNFKNIEQFKVRNLIRTKICGN